MRKKDKTPKKNRRTTKTVHYVTQNIETYCTVKMYKIMSKYQHSTNLLIPKLPFSRLVREIMQKVSPGDDFRLQTSALEALQQSAEHYLTLLFIDANRCAGHAKRVTVKPLDVQMVLDIRGPTDPGFG